MERPFNLNSTPSPLPDSLWVKTAEPAPDTQVLMQTIQTDVVIIGAGFTGLSCAIHLNQQGLSTVCMDASEIGWGASGRNNGQVIPGLKHDPLKVVTILGHAKGEPLVEYSGHAPKLVFDLIEKYQIKCDLVKKGWIQPAPSDSSTKDIEERVEQWQKYSAPVDMLNPSDLPRILGTDWYRSGWIDKRGGSLNPLSYVRGLARVAIELGVKLYTKSPVLNISKNSNEWVLISPSGKVVAKKLLICTNAYTGDLNKKVKRSIIPIRTAQIASSPLEEGSYASILPGGEAASDASKLLTSFRITSDKRLIMGGAYATGGDENQEMFKCLKQSAKDRFPFLDKIEWAFGWSGYLGVSKTHLPQILELDVSCYSATGCNGRGIAMSTATGKALAELVVSENRKVCPIPVLKPDPFYFHEFRHLGIAASVSFNAFRDKFKV